MARIVFDLDGTLIDSAPDIHAAVNRMLETEGAEPLSLARVTGFIGNGLPHLVARVIEVTDLDPARHGALTAQVLRDYEASSSLLTRPYPGMAPALAALGEAGHRLGLCTNKPEAPARKIVEEMGLGPFAAIVGGDSLPQRKPDPAPLHAAFAALGEGPRIYVGDSEVDAETARAAGVPFILFTEGYRKGPVGEIPHDVALPGFADLPAAVTRLLAADAPA
ncbi:MAG: phosphoglycolate phosphatase [Pseudooceanicola sp.]